MKVIILGSTSSIAREIGRQLAQPSDEFVLIARNLEEAGRDAADIAIRTGATVKVVECDVLRFSEHANAVTKAIDLLGGLDGVLVCFGYLGDQLKAQTDFGEARRIIETNFTAAVSIVELLAGILEEQASGFILGLSSVAGDRGRQSNYIYGASKAALTVYLQGLGHRLAASGVKVKIAKLGFVETKMTRGLQTVPRILRATPQAAADGVLKLLGSRSEVRYVPRIWWPIMLLVVFLPGFIFKRTRL